MTPALSLGRRASRNVPIGLPSANQQRFLSTAAAIQRGIRRSRRPSGEPPKQARSSRKAVGHIGRDSEARLRQFTDVKSSLVRKGESRALRDDSRVTSKWKGDQTRPGEAASSHIRNDGQGLEKNSRVGRVYSSHEQTRDIIQRDGRPQAPMAIPYTTPASEFLYGTSVVEAALTSRRRKIYRLYMYEGEQRRSRSQNSKIISLAAKAGIEVQRVSGWSWLSLFDKMSHGRPHNGCCLEASPLKRPTALSLLPPDTVGSQGTSAFRFKPGAMSSEDREVNGFESEVKVVSNYPRQPFVLLLDGVVDTGNLGGILRSAHFLGADAVAISGSCGQLNPIVLKASAGAAEVIPLLSVLNTTNFIDESKAAGWKVFASVAPPKGDRVRDVANNGHQTHFFLDSLDSPLTKTPCILMIGGEGDGLKNDLQKAAHITISIGSNRASKSTIDSLNVSVAAGILVEKFLRLPTTGEIRDVSTLW